MFSALCRIFSGSRFFGKFKSNAIVPVNDDEEMIELIEGHLKRLHRAREVGDAYIESFIENLGINDNNVRPFTSDALTLNSPKDIYSEF